MCERYVLSLSGVFLSFNCTIYVTGGKMWLCDHPDGTVLVYRVHPSGCDGLAPCYTFPHDEDHGVR